MTRTHSRIGTLGVLFLIAGAAVTAAQSRANPPAPHTPPTTPPQSQRPATPPATGKPATTGPTATSFKGIAMKLNTTSDALEQAFQTALQANPKLTRGQFVAANVLAQNLGASNSAITAQAILDGLKGGSSIGQTLQSLGLSQSAADKAQDDANREIVAAQHEKADSTK
jgi:hypothetical protein